MSEVGTSDVIIPQVQKRNDDVTRFNKRIEELIENIPSQNLLTPQFRTEYVRVMNLYKKVADYDTQLARDILESTFMFTYAFAAGCLEEIQKS